MPDQEMIDKVAMVFAKKHGVTSIWEHDRRLAIEVIEAMREPTEKMTNAGSFITTAQSGVYGPEDVWSVMIGTILK